MNKRSLTNNKKKVKRVANVFKGPGEKPNLMERMNASSIATAKEAFSGANLGSSLGTIGGAIGDITSAALANAEVDTTEADNAIQAVDNFKPNASDLDSLTASYNSLDFADTNWEGSDFSVSTGEGLANMGKAALSGVTAGASVGGVYGAIGGLAVGLAGSGAGWLYGAAKAKSKADELNRKAEDANYSALQRTVLAKDMIMENKTNDFLKSQKSYGGPLYNFSGDFDNGLVFINEGGTHEQNPFEGVLMGFDQQGIPNLVEEGEIIYNDYVFSNRLKPTKKLLADGGFSDKYQDWTFAKIVEDLQKESSERPNDIISKRGLDDMMNRMITMQETVRMKRGNIGQNKLLANGGHIFSGKKDVPKVNSSKLINAGNQTVIDSLNKSIEDTPFKAFLRMNDAPFSDINAMSQLRVRNPRKYQEKANGYYGSLFVDKNNFNWKTLGMLAPTVEGIGKLITNAATPVDDSNFVAEEAYSNIPRMKLGRVSGNKINYKGIDRNAFITPIINQGRAAARDYQNLGITGADVMNRLALNTYNTQRALAEAALKADQQDLANRLNVGQFNVGLETTDIQSSAREQMSDIERAKLIASGRIADATALEQAENAKLAAQDALLTNTTQGIADLTRQGLEWDMIAKNPAYAEYIAKMRNNAKCGGMLTKRKGRK